SPKREPRVRLQASLNHSLNHAAVTLTSTTAPPALLGAFLLQDEGWGGVFCAAADQRHSCYTVDSRLAAQRCEETKHIRIEAGCVCYTNPSPAPSFRGRRVTQKPDRVPPE